MNVDATCHTNNEKRHLLTFTLKSVSAKSFVFLKVYLPDQKAFHWVFQVAVPKLLGKKTSKQVRYAMTDGDSHKLLELDKALKKYFGNATCGRCGWHIINKGWKQHGISKNILADQQHTLKQVVQL
jgi:MULE transposase domain